MKQFISTWAETGLKLESRWSTNAAVNRYRSRKRECFVTLYLRLLSEMVVLVLASGGTLHTAPEQPKISDRGASALNPIRLSLATRRDAPSSHRLPKGGAALRASAAALLECVQASMVA